MKKELKVGDKVIAIETKIVDLKHSKVNFIGKIVEIINGLMHGIVIEGKRENPEDDQTIRKLYFEKDAVTKG